MKILIFSRENDFSTNDVIDWIGAQSKKVKWERIGTVDLCQISEVSISCSNGEPKFLYQSEPVNSAWFRKAFFVLVDGVNGFETRLKDFMISEINEFRKILYHSIPNCGVKVLGTNKVNFYDVNKMQVLLMAKNMGLDVPPTIITNSKKEIAAFKKEHGKIISKPLTNPKLLFSEDGNELFAMFTNCVDETVMKNLKESLMPSFVQKYISKAVELRIFFYEQKYYCAAIFSQGNENTMVDFRNYETDLRKINRVVPFNLDEKVKARIVKLMDLIGLNTGSIDMILTPDGEYFFLEVNPVGQFGMISHPCNYYLEKRVADFLLN